MQSKYGFTLLSVADFGHWLKAQKVARTVLYIQQHHTYNPDYDDFTGRNHFELQRAMRNYHVANNGWMDIAQHFTIFPDGTLMTGRGLEHNPAGILGFNQNAICIESIGNFDTGGDDMRAEQREAILRGTAMLCQRFNVPVTHNRIVYHHWFDLRTGARRNGIGITKSCPGTGFFGGNKVLHAEEHFLPSVRALLKGQDSKTVPPVLKYGFVNADVLNIRDQPGTTGKIVNTCVLGAVLRIYEVCNGWYKISFRHEEWVNGKFVEDVRRGSVNADVLNVRSGPGTQFTRLDTVAKGEEVFIYAESNDWLRVSMEQRWVSKKYVDLG